ncbi:MAG: tetratricopeptide repeat protein [Bacteroidota bacterium]|jgi:signal transduction histidine kinase|nr:tetratricopeptide repeat protein [Bacteroidota bacterium]
MITPKTRILLLLLLNITFALKAQLPATDSLIRFIESSNPPDSVKTKLYGDISWELIGTDINRSLEYAKKALDLSKITQNRVDLAQSESDIGNVYNRMGLYDSAMVHYFLALDIRKKLKQEDKMAGIYNNIATVYMRQNKFKEALDINFKSLKIFEKINDTAKQANVLSNIGNIYYELEQNEASEEFLKRGLSLASAINKPVIMGNILVNLGSLKFDVHDMDSALYYYTAAGKIMEENNLPYNLAAVYNNIGKIYSEKKDYKNAVSYYEKSLKNREELNDKFGIGLSNMNLGEAYLLTGEPEKSISYLNRAVNEFMAVRSFINLKQSYAFLAQVYESKNDYKTANKYFQLYAMYKDSVYTKENADKLAEMQTRFQTEKKDLEIEKQNDEIRLTKAEVERKNIITTVLIASIIFVILLSYLLYNHNKLKQKAILSAEMLHQQELRTKAVIEAEEKERMRIARDLHDGVGQTLSAAKLNLSSVENKLNLTEPDIHSAFKNAMDLVDESVKEVRAVSHSMMPNALLKQGLVAAVREFINRLSAIDNLKIDLEITGLNERLEASTETVLFRVLQEIVSNIIKHAKAKHITIQIIKYETELTIMIEDNGVGFDTSKMNEFNGIGLKNITSRIEFLKGTVNFDSSIGKGTTVIIEVPA